MKGYDFLAIALILVSVFAFAINRLATDANSTLSGFSFGFLGQGNNSIPLDSQLGPTFGGKYFFIQEDAVQIAAGAALLMIAGETSHPLGVSLYALFILAETAYRVYNGEWGFGAFGQ